MSNAPKVGFIGLGIMGSGMAANLLKAGYQLTVYNRTRAKAEPLVKMGASLAPSPADVASKSDVVIAIVTDGPDVDQVLFGENGVAEGKRRGLTFVDMGTNSPEYAKSFSERLSRLGIEFLDAPVTGGDKGAREGTLTIMAGGKEEVFRQVEPIFKAMGKTVVYAGGVGSGQMLKLANQIVVGLDMLAVVEAITMAKKAGIGLDSLFKVLSSGAGNSFTVQYYMPKIMNGDMEPGFRAAHIKKDLKYTTDVANSFNVPLPGTSLLLQLYNAVVSEGFGEKGTQALIKFYENSIKPS
ncbi:MAG: NAD(P)-dependent oxidoreductase [Thermoprotei archaeon]